MARAFLGALDHQARILGLYSASNVELELTRTEPSIVGKAEQLETVLEEIVALRVQEQRGSDSDPASDLIRAPG